MVPTVAFLAALLPITPATAADTGTLTRAPTLVITAAVERLTLSPASPPAGLTVDALGERIVLRTAAASATAARVRPFLASICPSVEVAPGEVVLRCHTRQLDADLTRVEGRTFLDIRALRGLPYRPPDQKLQVFYDPASIAGEACPGTTPAVRGECALADHQREEATVQFRLAVGTGQHAWASLRLGDLALAANDPASALRWYVRAGTEGPFGRLALLHRCELTGSCLDTPNAMAFNIVALPEPIAAEVSLRAARADAFRERVSRAVERLGALLAGEKSRSICGDSGVLFCRRLLLDLLQRADQKTGQAAIEAYLALPSRLEGPLVFELAEAAADRASAIGAPIFGGNVMSSVFEQVSPERMGDYLRRTAELFAAGGDAARARVVLEYAESRLDARQMSDARWLALRGRLRSLEGPERAAGQDEAHRFESLLRGAASDLAASRSLTARAHAISAAPGLVRASQ